MSSTLRVIKTRDFWPLKIEVLINFYATLVGEFICLELARFLVVNSSIS